MSDDGMLFEVEVLKVGVHVEPLGAKVESATDVGNNALPIFAYKVCSHPHVPVPLLQNTVNRNTQAVNRGNLWISTRQNSLQIFGLSCL